MSLNLAKVISATVLLSVITACTTPPQNQFSPENKPLVDSNKSAKNRPPNKTATISVEGEKTNINLKLYQEKNLFSTYFPEEDFLVETATSDQPKRVKFIANFGGIKNEDAYIQITFTDNFQNIAEVKNFITSKEGIIAANKWKIVSRSNTLTYPWAKEKIAFSKGEDIVGDIYIGEQNAKVFYVITHFPLEYGDGFSPIEDLVLSNLEIDK
ncbi:MAG: hypothetical protein RLZZ507_1628 [Cyanobacteriota bacterium]|jgi:hypothetical protein